MARGNHAGASLLIGLFLVIGAACGSPAPSEAPESRAAMDRCMAAAGYTVHPARSGSNGDYSWEAPPYYTWDVEKGLANAEGAKACRAKLAPARDRTEAELREIYGRWILERECLIGLGFTPRKPQTFEAFQRDWKTVHWTPIDGIPVDELQGEPMRLCGLEMIG